MNAAMTRIAAAWRAMVPEQRLAGAAALGLFVSMFLPWYSRTNTARVGNSLRNAQTSLSAFQAFSFVEAAVLLVSAGVIAIVFFRAEERHFALPGGDGLIVMVAGGWAALLIFYRMLDKPGLKGTEQLTSTVGVDWGIFFALLLALGVVYAGGRLRASEHPPGTRRRGRPPDAGPAATERPTDPDPAEERELPHIATGPATAAARAPVGAARTGLASEQPPPEPPSGDVRPRYPPAPPRPEQQMSFEEAGELEPELEPDSEPSSAPRVGAPGDPPAPPRSSGDASS